VKARSKLEPVLGLCWREPLPIEIKWVLSHVSRLGWKKGRRGINAHREAVRQNGLKGGRPRADLT
jgi:hypothetical protein